MTIDEMIKVLQGIKTGEMVQALPIRTLGDTFVWFDWPQAELNFQDYDYRVKPKPMEIYVNVYKSSGNIGYDSVHTSKESAKEAACGNAETVKFIEVME